MKIASDLQGDILHYIKKRQRNLHQIKQEFGLIDLTSARIFDGIMGRLIRQGLVSWYINELGETIYYYRRLDD